MQEGSVNSNSCWFIDQLIENMHNGFTNLILIIGKARIGKSFAALRICERVDPTFSIFRCVNRARLFVNRVRMSQSGQGITYDEPQKEFSARDFPSIQNKLIAFVCETMGFKSLTVCFAFPHLFQLDKIGRSMAAYLIRITRRGYGIVYSLEYDDFNDKFRTPKLGTLDFDLPSPQLIGDYTELKEATAETDFREIETELATIGQQPEKQREVVNLKDRELAKQLAQNLEIKTINQVANIARVGEARARRIHSLMMDFRRQLMNVNPKGIPA